MPERATAAEAAYMSMVGSLRCLICRRFVETGVRGVELHHVATGSGERSNFAVVPLCGNRIDGGHHRGPQGLHGLGPVAFVRAYRVPWEREEGMLVWVAEDLTALLRMSLRARGLQIGSLL